MILSHRTAVRIRVGMIQEGLYEILLVQTRSREWDNRIDMKGDLC